MWSEKRKWCKSVQELQRNRWTYTQKYWTHQIEPLSYFSFVSQMHLISKVWNKTSTMQRYNNDVQNRRIIIKKTHRYLVSFAVAFLCFRQTSMASNFYQPPVCPSATLCFQFVQAFNEESGRTWRERDKLTPPGCPRPPFLTYSLFFRCEALMQHSTFWLKLLWSLLSSWYSTIYLLQLLLINITTRNYSMFDDT